MAPLLTPLRPIDRDTLKILNKHLETGSGLVNKHVVDPVLDFVGPVIGGILRGLDNQNMNYSITPGNQRVKGPGNATATAEVVGNILDLPATGVAEVAKNLGAGPETQKLIHTAADLLIPLPAARALKRVKTGAQTLGTIKLPKTTPKIPITPSVKPTNGLTITTRQAQRLQLGKFSNNAIMRAKLGGAAAQRARDSGSVNLSNVVDVLSLPKTGTQRPPLTSAAIVEKFKDKGFVPSGTLPLARQVAQVIKMDTQLARVSNLKNPNTRYEALALPTWSQSTYLKSFNRLPPQLQKRILDLRARSGERVHLHHWNSKMVDAKRKERMIALVNEGKASRDDIRLLDFVLESRGEPGGGIWRPDGTKTIGALPEGFHQGVHARYQAAGLEKKWNWGSAVEKELGSIDNPTDLIEHAIQQRESMVPINLRVKDEAQRLWGLRF